LGIFFGERGTAERACLACAKQPGLEIDHRQGTLGTRYMELNTMSACCDAFMVVINLNVAGKVCIIYTASSMEGL